MYRLFHGFLAETAPTHALIDWVNSVAIPVLLSVVVGIPLAIYTGLIASRIFAFFQIRYRAVTWIFSLHEFLSPDDSRQDAQHMQEGTSENFQGPHDFMNKLGQAAYSIMVEARALGHERLRSNLAEILQSFAKKSAELTGVPMPPNGVPTLPAKLLPIQWLNFMNSIRDFYLAGLKPTAESLAATKPDIRPLFTPRLFPNYISGKRGFLGLLSRRPTSER